MDFSKLVHRSVKNDTWISRSSYMDFSNLIHGFLLFVTWTCQSCHMDLFKLLHVYVKVVLCISRPLPNKNKLKFGQDFKFCWSFCFELKLLNESKYSMPWVRCAVGNVLCFIPLMVYLANCHWQWCVMLMWMIMACPAELKANTEDRADRVRC